MQCGRARTLSARAEMQGQANHAPFCALVTPEHAMQAPDADRKGTAPSFRSPPHRELQQVTFTVESAGGIFADRPVFLHPAGAHRRKDGRRWFTVTLSSALPAGHSSRRHAIGRRNSLGGHPIFSRSPATAASSPGGRTPSAHSHAALPAVSFRTHFPRGLPYPPASGHRGEGRSGAARARWPR